MKKYLDIMSDILQYGTEKVPERKLEGGRKLDSGTIGLPNQFFSHNMKDGFPLLTTKKMGLKNIAIELEGFIKGVTSKKWYRDRGCNIWNEWANPKEVENFYYENYVRHYQKNKNCSNIDSDAPPPLNSIKKYLQQSIDDLGPIYGYQWRSFNKTYSGQNEDDGDFNNYVDQLKNVVDTLNSNPNDRRMVCSAWNPNQLHLMGLPACHISWVVTVYNNKLHLCWTQRSCDYLLGVPYNIASYALLLTLLAKHAKLEPGNLSGVLIDCHLYNNQIEIAKEQLTRTPKTLPTLEILEQNKDEPWDFWKWNHSQIKLHNYLPHPPLEKVEVVV